MNLSPEEDAAFKAQLLKDLPYFHRLYALYGDEQFLQIAQGLSKVIKKL